LAIEFSLMKKSIALLILLTAMHAVAETRIRIVGLERKSEMQVLELMGGRLEHVRQKEASASRADDAAFLLTQVLRKDGYANATVEWKLRGRSEIVLSVKEGGRLSLGTVSIRGVTQIEAKGFAELYAQVARKDRPITAGSAPFRETDVKLGLSNIIQELKAKGYWAADASEHSRRVDVGSGVVDLVIDVKQGPRHTIGEPRVVSPDGRGTVRTNTTLAPFVGLVATTGNLNALRLALVEAFTSRGYPDAKIRMGSLLDSGRFIPEIHIDLGQRVRLNQIHVVGLKRTSLEPVRERLNRLEGEWYDEAAMNRRVRGFLATGAFSSARVETEEVGYKRIDATLHFEEGRAKEVSLALGVDSYQGPLARVTYADRNLLGRLLGLNTGFELSARGLLGEAGVTDPWLFGSDVAGTARVYALSYDREGYSSFESGLDGKLALELGKFYELEILVGNSLVNLSDDGLPWSELGETVYTHPHLRVTQTFDHRDSSVLPTRGWHLVFPFEAGAAIGDLSTSYVSAGFAGSWHYKVNADYQIGLGGEFGILVPSGGGDDLPIDLRLFNGGSRSVRSFPDRELGPKVNGYPSGGESMWNVNAELVRRLGRTLRVVGFVDSGGLTRDFSDVGSGELEIAGGVGLRLDLPIGPVRFEYGRNLTRGDDEPAGTFHFAIGTVF
jgi:outer membrane protein assembly factor BamA